MRFSPQINPLYEACVYLSERYYENRLSKRISSVLSADDIKRNPRLADYLKISEIEKKLDLEIDEDDTLRFYFTPFKIKEKLPNECLSLGRTLISPPAELPDEISLDDLITYYSSLSQEELFTSFYNNSLFSSSTFSSNDCGSLAAFISAADNILTDPADKWNLIDAITNAPRHLERLRPIVEKAEEIIAGCSAYYESLVSECAANFSTEEKARASLDLLGYKLTEQEMRNVIFSPAVMMFNGTRISSGAPDDLRIKLGVYVLPLLKIRDSYRDFDSHLNILKLLSDSTRLKVLLDLRDRQSFGQELSERFDSTRNGMYYHLEKLFGSGLLDRKENGYRTLFTMNKQNVYNKLTSLRDFILDGWKPEDEE